LLALYKAREKVLKGWSLTTAVKLELLQRVAVWEFNRGNRRQLSIFYMACCCSLRDEMQRSSGAQASINQSGLECSEKSCSAQKRLGDWTASLSYPSISHECISSSITPYSFPAQIVPAKAWLETTREERQQPGLVDNSSHGTILAVVVLQD
jgi:hypothetical protein